MLATKGAQVIFSFVLVLCLLWCGDVVSADVEYKNRGNRSEGTRTMPVSGADIELISATVDKPTGEMGLPQLLRLRFYLPQSIPAFVTVRELKNQHFYWLDKVIPKRSWRAGFENQFQWPSADVLQKLKNIRQSDLGVLVRLDQAIKTQKERIAPAVFYSRITPTRVSEYRFVFKMGRDARLVYEIYKKGVASPLMKRPYKAYSKKNAYINWKSKNAKEGWYRLHISGRAMGTTEKWKYELEFYHQPVMGP